MQKARNDWNKEVGRKKWKKIMKTGVERRNNIFLLPRKMKLEKDIKREKTFLKCAVYIPISQIKLFFLLV